MLRRECSGTRCSGMSASRCSCVSKKLTYPFQRIEVQVLHLAMFKETCQPHAVVCDVGFLADDDNIILAISCVEFEELFSGGWKSC